MGGWRLIAAMASTVLAVPASAVAGPPLSQPEPDELPCPVAELTDQPELPSPPAPPAHRPGDQELGGARLDTAGLVVPSGAPAVPGDLSATSWLVADLDTGAVLGGCGPHQHGIPASTQKLLLAAALLPELDPDQVVEVTRKDVDIEPGSSAVGLVVGGEYPIETLWLGLLLNSGNDAANVLARVGGGEDGVEGGLRAMNEQAWRLGAYQTQAVTPSGLDGPGQFTSAYDLALISRVLFDRSDFRRYVATERVGIPAQPDQNAPGFQIQNQNDLLASYPGALGGKTGFTDLARHSFVGAAEQDGRRLVVTLLGAEVVPQPGWQQGAALLDWGFSLPADASVGRLVEPDELAERATSSAGSPSPSPATGPGGGGPPGASAATPAETISFTAVAGAALAAGGLVTLVTLLVTGRRRRGSGTVAR
ncbi:MAG: D-alanyl-D-alanine carboxypeptidase [Micromonosporaceae bacterium]|nr:D-alanyl-D-alanine carboxypeptidase [Micromonosporaceae bacterium]